MAKGKAEVYVFQEENFFVMLATERADDGLSFLFEV